MGSNGDADADSGEGEKDHAVEGRMDLKISIYLIHNHNQIRK